MKPKWGDESKYMGLENPTLFPIKLHVYFLMVPPFALVDYWTLPFFTVALSWSWSLQVWFSHVLDLSSLNSQ